MGSLRQSIRKVRIATDGLGSSVEVLKVSLISAEAALAAGASDVAVVSQMLACGEPVQRRQVGAAIDRYEAAVRSMRSHLVKILHDDAGMSFTAIGQMTGISRPLAQRLYKENNLQRPPRAHTKGLT